MLSILGCGDAEDPKSSDTAASPSGDTASAAVVSSDDTGDAGRDDTGEAGRDDTGGADTGEPAADPFVPNWPDGTDPFADAVVEFDPGPDAGFGGDGFPEIVLGSPQGRGTAGSLDVLSLGELGSITLEMTDLEIIDGPGPDLLVFENAFSGWAETGRVEASENGVDWYGGEGGAENADGDFPGCAGVQNVYATGEFLVDPTDPLTAGGDAFDLSVVGLSSARFVRITDSGFNAMGYGGETGGFDLDAIAAVNWAEIPVD